MALDPLNEMFSFFYQRNITRFRVWFHSCYELRGMTLNPLNEMFSFFYQRNVARFRVWSHGYYENLVGAFSSLRDPDNFRHSLQLYAGRLFRDLQLREDDFRDAFRNAGNKMAAVVRLADRIYYDDGLRFLDVAVFGYRMYTLVVSMLGLMRANARKDQASSRFDYVVGVLRSDLIM